MADDWIKMRNNLWTHPKVLTLAVKLGVSKATAIGCLHGVWSVADQHAAADGRLDMPAEVLDAIIDTPGFCGALASAGWLTIGEGWVQFVDYLEHNGSTAKARAENTRRQRTSRQCRASVAQSCDKSATREEKRREENISPPTPPAPDEGDSGSSPPPNAAEDWGGVEKALVEEDVNIPGACVRACQANGLTPAQAGAAIRRWREVSGKQGPGALVAMLRELRPGPALEKLLGSGAAAKLERQRREAAESERRRAEEAAELTELERSAGRLLDALGNEEAEHLARSALDDGTGGGAWYTWVWNCRGKPPRAWPAGIRLRCLRVMTGRSEVKRP